jgi:uncharacterized protein YjbI with pentapeptide repeats
VALSGIDVATKAGAMSTEADRKELQERWSVEPPRVEMLRALLRDRSIPALVPFHGERVDLRGAPLSGADLEGIAFDGVDLSAANLSGARLSRSSLWKTCLSGATLDHANLTLANLTAAQLSGASMTETIVSRADANGACLAGANLDGAELTSANFEHANLAGASLRRAGLRDTYLQGASLERVDLSAADLRGAHLQKARLTAANLSAADLGGALMGRANLDGAYLAGSNLAGVDLRGASLRFVYLHNAVLSGALLTGAKLDDGVAPTHILIASNQLRLEEAMIALLVGRIGIAEIRSTGARLIGLPLENTHSLPDAVRWLLAHAIARRQVALPAFHAPMGGEPASTRSADLQELVLVLERTKTGLDAQARELARDVARPVESSNKREREAILIFEATLNYLLCGDTRRS